jgi:16S rRNA (uracil1498-N3)-methyltransferase
MSHGARTPVRAPVPGLSEGTRTLSRETSHYLCRVLRLDVGDAFVAFDPEAMPRREADAVLEVASGDAAVARMAALRAPRVVAAVPLAVVYGLSKGDKVDTVVQDATELGATRIVLAPMARSVVKLDKAGDARTGSKILRWRKIAEQAARQCGRADPPDVALATSLDDALEGALGDAPPAGAARFCLWERAAAPLGPALAVACESGAALAFLIGPEGGIAEDEVTLAASRGFVATSLGPFVLRTETVAAAVLGAVRILSSA